MSSRVVGLLQELIRIPSVNPDGDPGTDHTGEGKIAAFVGEFLEKLGAEVAIEEVLPGRPNVIGRFPNHQDGAPRVILGPHLDTVTVAGMTVDPFGAEIKDGKLYGRGACDTKGTMAAMLAALEELGDQTAELGAEVTFAGFMGEETGQHGSKHFAATRKAYDFALVGEPTGNDIVFTHKGNLWVQLITEGKAAHGSAPEQGVNAITQMAEVITRLDRDFRPLLAESFSDPVLGPSTLNIGMCHGGTRSNIVAAECTTSLDLRVTPDLHAKGAEKVLSDFVKGCGFEFDVRVAPESYCAPLHTDPENPFVRKLVGIGSQLVGAPWFCDAAFLAQGGTPAVAAGPGSIAQAHTKDEWISIGELEEGVGFYRRFLEAL